MWKHIVKGDINVNWIRDALANGTLLAVTDGSYERETAPTVSVGTLKDRYIRRVPLPRVPRIQSTSSPVACATIHRNPIHTGYLPIERIPTWSDLIESLSGLGR